MEKEVFNLRSINSIAISSARTGKDKRKRPKIPIDQENKRKVFQKLMKFLPYVN